jgi:hypothetical protein
MPIRYGIKQQRLTITAEDHVEFEEGFAVFTKGLKLYSETQPLRPCILFDIRTSKEDRTADELKGIAAMVSQYVKNAHIAIVVQSELLYGLSRMFSVYASRDAAAIKIFSEEADALQWLGDDSNNA